MLPILRATLRATQPQARSGVALSMKTFWNFLSGMILGATVGALAALVLAPQSGGEIRKEIRREIEEILSEGRRAASKRRSELEDQLAQLRREG